MQMMSSWHTFPFPNIINYLMDCCFLIGGICTSTSMLHALNQGRFNIFSVYFHRFLRYLLIENSSICFFHLLNQKLYFSRLTPLYFIIFFFMSTLAGRLGAGPNWNYVQYPSEDCRSNWFYHLLYVNNWFPDKLTFVRHSYIYTSSYNRRIILMI